MSRLENRRTGFVTDGQSLDRQEVLGPQDIVCGIASTSVDRRKRLELVTERYLEVGYITPDDTRIVDGVFVDHFEASSIPIIAKVDDEVVGSLRLIPNLSGSSLPMQIEEEISVYPDWQERVDQAPFEWSQLVKSRSAKDSRPLYGLIRAAFDVTRRYGVNQGVAVIDTKVRKYLNGARTSFNLPEIGEAVDYMGSFSTPIFIDFDNVIRSCQEAGKDNLSRFIDTGKAEGFEWYKGT